MGFIVLLNSEGNMVLIRRSFFPLSKLNIKINDFVFELRPNQIKCLYIEDDSIECLDVEVRSYWTKNKKNLRYHKNATIKIMSAIPDLYYLLGGGVVLLLCLLLFWGIIHPLLLGIVNLIYVLPIVYYTFFAKEKYFKIYYE